MATIRIITITNSTSTTAKAPHRAGDREEKGEELEGVGIADNEVVTEEGVTLVVERTDDEEGEILVLGMLLDIVAGNIPVEVADNEVDNEEEGSGETDVSVVLLHCRLDH